MKLWTSVSLLTFFVFAALTTFSQRQITARVVDSETKKALKDVVVRIEGTEIVTTTNSMGYFQLTIDSIKSLIITSAEYDSIRLTVPEVDKFQISLVKFSIPPENLAVKPDGDKVFMVVDEPAEYTGGLPALSNFLAKHLHYPIEAKRVGIEGTVFVSFIIDKNGVIDQESVESVKGVHWSLDAEAIRVIKSFPDWIPGKVKGQPVKCRFVLPIRFKLGN